MNDRELTDDEVYEAKGILLQEVIKLVAEKYKQNGIVAIVDRKDKREKNILSIKVYVMIFRAIVIVCFGILIVTEGGFVAWLGLSLSSLLFGWDWVGHE